MAKVQKTVSLEVRVTIEVDEDLIGTDEVDDPFQMADNVSYGLHQLNDSGDLFRGGDVKEYSVNVLEVKDTQFQYL